MMDAQEAWYRLDESDEETLNAEKCTFGGICQSCGWCCMAPKKWEGR